MAPPGKLTVQKPEIVGHLALRLRPNNALEPSRPLPEVTCRRGARLSAHRWADCLGRHDNETHGDESK